LANLKQFRLPDLGEGLTEGEILKWLVSPGETVKLNQPIVEVETAKAAVEVPSPYAGLVTELHHGEGETVDVGAPIITFDTEPGATPGSPAGGTAQRAAQAQAAGAAANPAESASAVAAAGQHQSVESEMIPAALIENPPDEGAVEPGLIGGPAPGGRTSVLVGYGPKSVAAKRRPRKSDDGAPSPVARLAPPSAPAPPRATAGRGPAVLAKPPVRKLARDLGVDLAAVEGTGPNGTITRADVEAATGPAEASAVYQLPTAAAAPTLDPAAREERIPVKGIRKMTAAAMVASAFSAPHVTEFLTADVTPTMELVSRLRGMPEFADVKVSPLLLLARALLVAVKRNPMVNSSWDDPAQEIVVKDYVNLGIAAATPRGLIVPNIKDAGRLTLVELARELQTLTEVARAGRTAPGDMSGGTITITNVGVFGVDTGTPIINPGESAILAFGVVRPTPWVHESEIAVRQVTTLALSFDHRIVDGALGSMFLADIGSLLADPTRFLAWS
jgi:2-oxoisovalerate dehydrogenase E2 component (dihydrolipoyl transacylase)